MASVTPRPRSVSVHNGSVQAGHVVLDGTGRRAHCRRYGSVVDGPGGAEGGVGGSGKGRGTAGGGGGGLSDNRDAEGVVVGASATLLLLEDVLGVVHGDHAGVRDHVRVAEATVHVAGLFWDVVPMRRGIHKHTALLLWVRDEVHVGVLVVVEGVGSHLSRIGVIGEGGPGSLRCPQEGLHLEVWSYCGGGGWWCGWG